MATINLGAIKFNWKGAYNNSTAYAVDDVVSSGGSSYVCILASTGNAVSNGTYWNQMSAAGTNGTNGTQGQAGAYVQIVVAASAPTLYYYCSSHSGMGGTANTPTPANNSLRYITTNQGQDNITESQYANFDDVLFSASGFVFSINTNGNLITTI